MLLEQKHAREREVLEASFEAEEAEHIAEISKKISEEHRDAIVESNRKQIAIVRRFASVYL